MRPFIVITSIFPPTPAVEAFARRNDSTVVVVGDDKTPADWCCANVEFLPIRRHGDIGRHLHRVLPHNHYCRKMIGYLSAIEAGARVIVDTDDDNIPKENWCFPPLEGAFDCLQREPGFVNIYQLYTRQQIWPRGLPLRLVSQPVDLRQELSLKPCTVGVWQGLADEDPDVDAVYRLTSNEACCFEERAPVVLEEGVLSPFNTQNTLTRQELFPLLYLPTHVTFRFTDILRGLVAQPIMWRSGYRLGFTNATVVQKRNPHDYLKDFLSEVPMYEHGERVPEIAAGAAAAGRSPADNLFAVYEALAREQVVEKTELDVLAAWLKDMEQAADRSF
jgi:hypothetical protein